MNKSENPLLPYIEHLNYSDDIYVELFYVVFVLHQFENEMYDSTVINKCEYLCRDTYIVDIININRTKAEKINISDVIEYRMMFMNDVLKDPKSFELTDDDIEKIKAKIMSIQTRIRWPTRWIAMGHG